MYEPDQIAAYLTSLEKQIF